MRLVGELARDVRQAARALRREPSVVLGVLLSVTLALGASTALLGFVRRLMLAPPPGVADAARVARVRLAIAARDGERYEVTTTSYPAFRALASSGAFAGVAAARTDTVTMGTGADTRTVAAVQATGAWFATLGARPLLGRLWGEADDVLPAGNAVVVLGHAFWRRAMAGDPGVLGREIVLGGEPFTIVGVAAPDFNGDGLAPVDVFVPLTTAMRDRDAGWMTEPGMNLVEVLVRLRDGTTSSVAATMATAALREVGEGRTEVALASLVPGADARRTPQARMLLWISGVALVVMVVAVANVATLLLLRATRRRREIAVRVALGIGRGRLARLLATESVLLVIAGALCALVAERWIARVVGVVLLPGIALPERGIDAGGALAVIAAACAMGVVAVLPALRVAAWGGARDGAWPALHGASHGAGGSTRTPRSQHALVLVQVALCTVLVVGAGLFVRSLQRVQSQELGLPTRGLLWVTLDFRDALPAATRDAVHLDAARVASAMDGVTGATVVQGVPFGPHAIPPISVPGLPEPPSAGGQLPIMYGATPAYLRLLGVRLREGRLIDARDGRGTPPVVLVNETMAREVWPGRSAVGQCIRIGFDPDAEPSPMAPATLPCREVVGVVADSRARSLLPDGREASLMQYYVPFAQLPAPPIPDIPGAFGVLVGVTGDVDAQAARVQRLVQGTSAHAVYARVRPYETLLDPQLRPWRLGATLFTALGALAVLIAAVGLFAVVSYLVTLRTRELGVRHALGGTRSRIGGAVVLDAVRLVAVGVVGGLVVALAAGRLVEPMLFRTSARDAVVLAGTGLVLLAVTMLAAGWPAVRAGRVSPMEALRGE